ncbi:hypothetical protein MTR67_038835 [Solanum verrucosum]|uniref:DUF4216 domain-containing protein n=1 Tax=Solanum verrucosum TaxID=315347 RepID=A0AAF0UGR0_SOLVR|nr:hypothetical protein MTR67_038835 [Solanum verrucosum]
MFLQFVLAFSAYLHVLGTQFSQKFSSQCSVVRPRPVLVVRGSPLQPFPKPAQKNWLSPDSRTDPRSVDQTTVRGLCPWIKTSLTQPLTQTTVDQHGPSFDPRSIGWPKKTTVLFRCEWFDPSHRGTKVDHQHNIIEVKHTRKYISYDPFIIAQNAKQVYYAPYQLRRDKADWWIVIKTKIVGGIKIDNVLDVAYQNDVAIVHQQVDDELETTLQHPQHILEEVSDDEIMNVEEEISENEENNHLMTKNGTLMKMKQLRRKNGRVMELKQRGELVVE